MKFEIPTYYLKNPFKYTDPSGYLASNGGLITGLSGEKKINKMKNKFAIFLFSILLFTACDDEIFPEKDDLIGTWTYQTDDAFKPKLKFEEEYMYLIGEQKIDTFSYQLNKKEQMINFQSTGIIPSLMRRQIEVNPKTNKLSIWGFFGGEDHRSHIDVFKK